MSFSSFLSRFYFILLFILSFTHVKSDDQLRKKIGQMVMVGFTGNSLTLTTASIESLKIDLQYRNLGGVIIGLGGSQTTQNPTQIQILTSQLQLYCTIPLFIAIDQEGGNVARLNGNNGFRSTPTAFTLGTTIKTEDSTRSTARLMAGWLKQSGINVNLAPVVDVNVNPSSPAIGASGRSYSKYPAVVSSHANWFIDEFHKKSIITTLKHFPGHGSALTDSHLGFTDITKTWADSELVPYSTLLNTGVVDIIMTGHLYNATIDSIYPATLSQKTLTGILRNSLGYNGVIITDEMFMRAIRDNYNFEKAVELAVNAGADILLFSTNLMLYEDKSSIAGRIIDLIEKKVYSGIIPSSRIDESYNRIMSLKSKYLGVNRVPFAFNSIPNTINLSSYPNPFNATTNIHIELQSSQKVQLKIFDILGREVETLIDENLNAGLYNVRWDATRFAGGTYFCKLVTFQKVITQKIVLIK